MQQKKYTFDIVQEKDDNDQTNLFCIDLDTMKIPYYCQSCPAEAVTIREGGELGPIIGTANICHSNKGVTEVGLNVERKIIQLKHGHHSQPHSHSITTFRYDGEDYGWEGHSELYRRDVEGNVLIAEFYPVAGTEEESLGTVEIYCDGEKMSKIVVITFMVLLKRGMLGRLRRMRLF